MLCFFGWLGTRQTFYLIASAVLFGLSLYSYSVVKAFAPLMLGLLTILYWRELGQVWRKALLALGVIAVIATPQIALTMRHRAEMQARYNQMSLFNYMEKCPGCAPAPASTGNDSTFAKVENFSANWAGYFTPSFSVLHRRSRRPLVAVASARLRAAAPRAGAADPDCAGGDRERATAPQRDRAGGMAGAGGDSGCADGAIGRLAAGGGRADAVRPYATASRQRSCSLPVSCLIIPSRGAISWR